MKPIPSIEAVEQLPGAIVLVATPEFQDEADRLRPPLAMDLICQQIRACIGQSRGLIKINTSASIRAVSPRGITVRTNLKLFKIVDVPVRHQGKGGNERIVFGFDRARDTIVLLHCYVKSKGSDDMDAARVQLICDRYAEGPENVDYLQELDISGLHKKILDKLVHQERSDIQQVLETPESANRKRDDAHALALEERYRRQRDQLTEKNANLQSVVRMQARRIVELEQQKAALERRVEELEAPVEANHEAETTVKKPSSLLSRLRARFKG